MPRSNELPLIVAGGGIGGLAAALAVAQTGRSVRVLERAQHFGEIGAGLQLAPNASQVLERLGVLDAIAPCAVYPRRIIWRDARTGDRVTGMDLGEPFRARYRHPYVVMHRSDLLDVLLDACRADERIELDASRSVVDVEDHADRIRVTCADGAAVDGIAAVAADGLWSRLRKLVHDDGDPIAARYVAYRGTIPVAELWDGAGVEDVTVWTAPGLHFVQYPIRGGQLFNQVAVFTSPRYHPDNEDWAAPGELDARFAAGCDAVRAGIARIARDRYWTMYDREPIATWSRGRLALLGDAAHPMLQYLAQGACQALEDGVVLADALSEHAEPADAFLAYRDRRYLRTARVQYSARLFGEIWHTGDVGATLRDAMLANRPDDDFSHTDWLYGWRPGERSPHLVS